MEIIKFRAWDKVKNQMREVRDLHWDGHGGIDVEYSCAGINDACGGQDTLMQFTRIQDKNGKEIYEGDLIYKRQEHNGKRVKLRPDLSIRESYWRVVFSEIGEIVSDDDGYRTPGFFLTMIHGTFTPRRDIEIRPDLGDGFKTINQVPEMIVQNEEWLDAFITFTPNSDWITTLEVIGNIYENPEFQSGTPDPHPTNI